METLLGYLGYNNSDSDSESTQQTNVLSVPGKESSKIASFREAISLWKQQQLEAIINEKKDPHNLEKLNRYVEKTGELANALKKAIETGNTKNIKDETLLKVIGDFSALSPNDLVELSHAIDRDLLEVRFTYDTKLINEFNKDEKLVQKLFDN